MRDLRPEYYSDTQPQTIQLLSAELLEYRLDTITARNETHEFELFCRKLCEHAICPNLRPQTGPEGGGDSKADSETYPVADEVSCRLLFGDANGGRERWAFAFSANKKWSAKVRGDVKGLIETGRNYNRIICVTSRFARSKDRARIEDELTKKYGVAVTIHDRSWIVQETLERGRAHLAVNYLNVGDLSEAHPLGPTDYSRTRDLEDLEREFDDPDAYAGMERQLVTEALLAAKLSRGLERPRVETDGRFERAIRLADKYGGFRQRLEARYERIWTAYWWYDDFEQLNASYSEFETMALQSDSALNLDFLSNLLQLLVNSALHGHMSAKSCQLRERVTRLEAKLEPLATDLDRPNNALEARTSLARIRLNKAILTRDEGGLSAVWAELEKILEQAEGLGEFDADSFVKLVEIAANIAGNNPAYNALVDRVAAFVGKRQSEGEGALVLLRRAEQLDFEDHFDMIRWLGRAAVGLAKREYAGALIDATRLLALAYRSADLLWASRVSCLFGIASLVAAAEEDGDFSAEIVPATKLWAWISLGLGHLPDLLSAIQLLNGFFAALPLDDESKARLRDDLVQLDMALGCHLLNLENSELAKLKDAPDVLEALGLVMARTALLYALGYKEVLRGDGSLPPDESEEAVRTILSRLKSQPLSAELPRRLVLNPSGKQALFTTILGMQVEVEIDDDDQLLIGEAILGTLEAFFATVIEQEDIAPHVESFRITVSWSADSSDRSVQTSDLDMICRVSWPRDLPFPRFDTQHDAQMLLLEIAGNVMGATCFVADRERLLESLFADEAVLQRTSMIIAAPNSFNRVTARPFARLSDWGNLVKRSYPIREGQVALPRVELVPEGEERDEIGEPQIAPKAISRHRGVAVRSVIDLHAWDKAVWRGCGYAQMGPGGPPGLMLLFENSEAARKIFQRWRDRFGKQDEQDEIAISIITALPNAGAHHYCVQVASGDPTPAEDGAGKLVQMPTRSMVMEPATSTNLNLFTSLFPEFGFYYLMPAIVSGSTVTDCDVIADHSILKRKIVVKPASEVGAHDLESLALRAHGFRPKHSP